MRLARLRLSTRGRVCYTRPPPRAPLACAGTGAARLGGCGLAQGSNCRVGQLKQYSACQGLLWDAHRRIPLKRVNGRVERRRQQHARKKQHTPASPNPFSPRT